MKAYKGGHCVDEGEEELWAVYWGFRQGGEEISSNFIAFGQNKARLCGLLLSTVSNKQCWTRHRF